MRVRSRGKTARQGECPLQRCEEKSHPRKITKHILDDRRESRIPQTAPANVRGNTVDVHLMHTALWPPSSSPGLCLLRFIIMSDLNVLHETQNECEPWETYRTCFKADFDGIRANPCKRMNISTRIYTSASLYPPTMTQVRRECGRMQ